MAAGARPCSSRWFRAISIFGPFFFFWLGFAWLGVGVRVYTIPLPKPAPRTERRHHTLAHSLTHSVGGVPLDWGPGVHRNSWASLSSAPFFFFFFRAVRTAKRSECSFFLPSLAFLLGCAGSQERRERGEREPSLVSRTVWKISGGCRCASTAS